TLNTQVEALKTQLARYEKDVQDAEARLTRERSDADSATKELSDERGKVENLDGRVAQLERALIAQTTEAEILSRRAQDLETRLAEPRRLLVAHEHAAYQRLADRDDPGERADGERQRRGGGAGTRRRRRRQPRRPHPRAAEPRVADAHGFLTLHPAILHPPYGCGAFIEPS